MNSQSPLLSTRAGTTSQRPMKSIFPRKPLGENAVQLSKALPLPPEPPPPPPIKKDKVKLMSSTATLLPSVLPPAAKDLPDVPKISTMSIPRRPVGRAQTDHAQTVSIAKVPSISSPSPEILQSLSNGGNKAKDTLLETELDIGFAPPLPRKDSERKQEAKQRALENPASGFETSPLSSEIWRRRSIKSDKSIIFPQLKLRNSNGSTTAPLPQQELAAVPSQFTGSSQIQKDLPAPPQIESGAMGNKLSKLKTLAKRDSETNKDVQPQPQPQLQPQHRSYAGERRPTPEYLKPEKHQPPKVPQVLSPVPPESSLIEVASAAVPYTANSQSTSSLITVIDTTKHSSYARDDNDALSRPILPSTHSQDTSETLTITSEPQVMRFPQPQKTYASKILTPTPSPPPTVQALPLPSPAPINSPTSIFFPKITTLAAPGTIFQGPQLNIVHFKCYLRHTQMHHSKNILCPVACMICRKQEIGPLWRCSWCCMGACASCMQILTSIPGRDVKVCLELIKKKVEVGHKSGGSGSWK